MIFEIIHYGNMTLDTNAFTYWFINCKIDFFYSLPHSHQSKLMCAVQLGFMCLVVVDRIRMWSHEALEIIFTEVCKKLK